MCRCRYETFSNKTPLVYKTYPVGGVARLSASNGDFHASLVPFPLSPLSPYHKFMASARCCAVAQLSYPTLPMYVKPHRKEQIKYISYWFRIKKWRILPLCILVVYRIYPKIQTPHSSFFHRLSNNWHLTSSSSKKEDFQSPFLE